MNLKHRWIASQKYVTGHDADRTKDCIVREKKTKRMCVIELNWCGGGSGIGLLRRLRRGRNRDRTGGHVGEAAAGEGGERRARVSGGVVGRASNYAGGFAGIAWVVCEWAGTGMGFGEEKPPYVLSKTDQQ